MGINDCLRPLFCDLNVVRVTTSKIRPIGRGCAVTDRGSVKNAHFANCIQESGARIFELLSKREDMGNTSPPALGSVLASKVGSFSPPYLEFGDF